MRKLERISITLLVALALLIPATARAEMGHHQEEGSHERHGGQHHEMEKNVHMMGVDAVFDNYFAIQASLAGDSMEGIPEKAKALAEAITQRYENANEGDAHKHGSDAHALMTHITDSTKSLAKKTDMSSAREEFGKLSEKMVEYWKLSGEHQSVKAHAFRCDMANKVWLQDSDEIRNPYYGSAMLRCGREIK